MSQLARHRTTRDRDEAVPGRQRDDRTGCAPQPHGRPGRHGHRPLRGGPRLHALRRPATARQAVGLLNEFFGVVVPLLEAHGGHANAFLGDGVRGVFGAPEALPDHGDRAVVAAAAIAAAVDVTFGDRCRVSIGVNSGLVLVGTVGGGSRFELAVIGDPVNVAAPVEQATRGTGDAVLVTEATRCLLDRDDVALEPRGELALKGKAQLVRVFGLGGRAGGHAEGRAGEGDPVSAGQAGWRARIGEPAGGAAPGGGPR